MPRKMQPLSRRKFLRAAAAAAAAGPLASCGGGSGTSWKFFTPAEARAAGAICERLIPADDAPGAEWAGVVRYIDRQLAGPLADYGKDYRAGLAAIDRTCESLHGRPFADLTPVEQDAVLAAVEKGEVPAEAWKAIPPKAFFDRILDNTREGFYGDPRHGGNRDAASWAMLGLEHPQVRGRRHDPKWRGRT